MNTEGKEDIESKLSIHSLSSSSSSRKSAVPTVGAPRSMSSTSSSSSADVLIDQVLTRLQKGDAKLENLLTTYFANLDIDNSSARSCAPKYVVADGTSVWNCNHSKESETLKSMHLVCSNSNWWLRNINVSVMKNNGLIQIQIVTDKIPTASSLIDRYIESTLKLPTASDRILEYSFRSRWPSESLKMWKHIKSHFDLPSMIVSLIDSEFLASSKNIDYNDS